MLFWHRSLKTYRRKYAPIRMALIVGKPFDVNFQGLAPHELEQLRQVETILEHPRDYIDFVPQARYVEELPRYYSRAKLCVLGSLLEGKNRAIYEAMSCNTPVVCFRQFNQYARGDTPAFPAGAGLCAAEFDPESLADTFHQVLQNEVQFRPRQRFLESSGRKHFFNRCVDSFPYYERALPDYARGGHFANLWLDLAVQANYQLSLNDFLYNRNPRLSHVRGLKAIAEMLKFYFTRFGLQR
jgi:glycosyltransferase involved in cell wall biosynthesis